MKKFRNYMFSMVAFMLCATTGINAQNFQGVATYQSAMKTSGMRIVADGMTPEMNKQLEAQLKKQSQREYELEFNLTEATWKQVESLGNAPASASSGNAIITIRSGSDGITYKNTAENLYLREADMFGKAFLIQGELENSEWQLTGESKQIGNYSAQKATFTTTVERRMMSFSSGPGAEDNDTEPEIMQDTITVEAWFTTDIPVAHGPGEYWGLPGLILELSNNSMTYLCTKVVLNPEEEIEIKRPKKGKKVTREEFEKIQEEKMKEMSEKYNGGGSGTTRTIRIGGN